MRLIGKSLYGLYVVVLFTTFGLAALLVMILLPGLRRRRWLARVTSRAFLHLAGMPLTVEGLERLPPGHLVGAIQPAADLVQARVVVRTTVDEAAPLLAAVRLSGLPPGVGCYLRTA